MRALHSSPVCLEPFTLDQIVPGRSPSSRPIPRPALVETLLASNARLRLLCAPAGSGKTTLVSECLGRCPGTTRLIWIPLEGLTIGAPHLIERLALSLGLAQGSSESQVLVALKQNSQPLWLMLDDWPRQPTAELDALLDRLLAASSVAIRWWLTCRRRPLINLYRLLLEGELFELDGQALAFQPTEIELLMRQSGWKDSSGTREALLEVTSGWCAGVRLQLLGNQDEPLKVAALLHDYIFSEVLAPLSDELRDALQILALLPKFNEALCDHLLGKGEGQRLLQALRSQGLFIQTIPSTTSRAQWSRLLRPVASLLAGGPCTESAAIIHLRAGQWFSSQGETHLAVEHTLKAGRPDLAVGFLRHLRLEQLMMGPEVALLMGWRTRIPADLVADSPELIILFSWALLFAGCLDQARQSMKLLQRFLPLNASSGPHELLTQSQLLQGYLAYMSGHGSSAREQLSTALQQLPGTAWPQRLLCRSALTRIALAQARLHDAETLNHEALKEAREQNSLAFETQLELDRAQLLTSRGELNLADLSLQHMQGLIDALPGNAGLLQAHLHIARGHVSLRLGRHCEAQDLLLKGVMGAERGDSREAFSGHLGLAEIDAMQGHLLQALSRLTKAERHLQCLHVDEHLYAMPLALMRAKLQLQSTPGSIPLERLSEQPQAHWQQHQWQARKQLPPPGFPELPEQIELLLAEADWRSGATLAALERLTRLHRLAQDSGRFALAYFCCLKLAENHHALSNYKQAQCALMHAQRFAQRLQWPAPLQSLQKRQPDLFLQSEVSRRPVEPALQATLSDRELTVLRLIAQGLSNQEVGERLFISLHTVKTHARKINFKLGVERRTQAVAQAKAIGLLV